MLAQRRWLRWRYTKCYFGAMTNRTPALGDVLRFAVALVGFILKTILFALVVLPVIATVLVLCGVPVWLAVYGLLGLFFLGSVLAVVSDLGR